VQRARFERLVAQALDTLRDLGADILGLYQGASEMEQSPMAPYELPEVIVIYQDNIEAVCRTDAEIIDEIRKTVIHEVGHHFGLTDDQMEAWEENGPDDG